MSEVVETVFWIVGVVLFVLALDAALRVGGES